MKTIKVSRERAIIIASNHKKASNQIKDPNHLKAITNTHHPPQPKKNTKINKLNHNLNP
jgi:hypothetical protein